jgi:hypothetical protein
VGHCPVTGTIGTFGCRDTIREPSGTIWSKRTRVGASPRYVGSPPNGQRGELDFKYGAETPMALGMLGDVAPSTMGGRRAFGQPKTYARRWVRLPKFNTELLAAHLAASVPADPDALVFTAGPRAVLPNSNFRRSMWSRPWRGGIAGGCSVAWYVFTRTDSSPLEPFR